ncbi:MAG TPA: acyl-CoA dehydrogenase family protein [Stellaceae bacterium]|jgi:acyl-CoA dehydrogenase|nr:acyl-CoA dehydrogenase family protein [Stellaceae bacterium]
MDFTIPHELVELRERTERFVREEMIPRENDKCQGAHGPSEELRRELVALGRRAGLLSPHVGTEWGGLGLDHRGKAVVFEAAGYSPLGPIAMNCFAPDEANMHLLEQVAEARQKEQWLRPLAAGDIRSCFMMTEPSPGAGADPSMLLTTARRDTGGNRGDFIIDGEKWLITGAVGAGFAIIMAKNDSDDLGPAGATMFLAPMDAPGIHIERILDTLDGYMAGGHAVIRLDGLRVPENAVLGKVGQGFRYAQARLAPARLTHCMRWLGAARRAHDIATDYARRRTAFGKPLGEHEGVGFMLADNEMDLHTCRLMIWHTAWVLDKGERGRHESSMAKVVCSEAIWRVVDRSMQVLGGLGITDDTIVARIFREVRPFRIYDGPSEVHRWSIAQRVLRTGGAG